MATQSPDTAPSGRDRRPDWLQADPALIGRALARSQALPSGGWYVLDATRTLRTTPLASRRRPGPRRYLLEGRELVAWTADDGRPAVVGPAACPHLGADLSCGRVDGRGRLVCPWHGLAFGHEGRQDWPAMRVHDDGVLTWVQPEPDAPGATDTPILPVRPDGGLDAVLRREALCEPADVIANRLDPWHGVHLHPYSFAHLEVIAADEDALQLLVAYRVAGRFSVEVEARFHCPEPRTIVMTITGGEGKGSVVETHATPLLPAAPGRLPRTAVIEATIADSGRPGFAVARRAAPLLRPVIRMMAGRLWRDDAAYAERRYHLRTTGWVPGAAGWVQGAAPGRPGAPTTSDP